eukprot:324967-Hanusia_phi.AAC.1
MKVNKLFELMRLDDKIFPDDNIAFFKSILQAAKVLPPLSSSPSSSPSSFPFYPPSYLFLLPLPPTTSSYHFLLPNLFHLLPHFLTLPLSSAPLISFLSFSLVTSVLRTSSDFCIRTAS